MRFFYFLFTVIEIEVFWNHNTHKLTPGSENMLVAGGNPVCCNLLLTEKQN